MEYATWERRSEETEISPEVARVVKKQYESGEQRSKSVENNVDTPTTALGCYQMKAITSRYIA